MLSSIHDRVRTPRGLRTAVLIVATVLAGLFADVALAGQSNEKPTNSGATSAVPVETVGSATVRGDQPGASWPGEIISGADLNVQPQREGTIVEWVVGVGQAVERGQVLATLSVPVNAPEAATSLAERAEQLAVASAELEAETAFADRRKAQLSKLRADLERSAADPSEVAVASAAAGTRAEMVRDYAEQAVRSIYALVTVQQGVDPIRNPGAVISFKEGVGAGNPGTRGEFTRDVGGVARALSFGGDVGSEARQFLRSADALAASSVESGEGSADLREVRSTVAEMRSAILETLGGADDARLEAATRQREVGSATLDIAERLADIDGDVLEIDQGLAVIRARAEAAKIAQNTVANGFGGNATIVAPRAGLMSNVIKSAGDYVEPGTAVASIYSGQLPQVRFKVPGNVQPPQAGEELVVSRPGFATDQKKIKVTGVGGALDDRAAYTADAVFLEPVTWPGHASVRVLAPTQDAVPPLVSLAAVWFDSQGRSNVWVVGDDDRIKPAVVKTGKSVGDKVELLEGGDRGARIVSSSTSDLRVGMKLPSGPVVPKESKDGQPASDGHDHAH